MATNVNQAGGGALRQWVAARPLTAFFMAGLFVIFPLAWLIPLSAHGAIPLPVGEWFLSPLIILFFAMTVFIIWADEGASGVRSFFARILRWRFGIGWWLAFAIGLPLLAIAFNLAMGVSLRTEGIGGIVLRQAGAAITGMLLVNLWEESVWAGFLQTRLERSYRILPAAWLTAIPFVIIHIPLQFIGEFSLASVAVGVAALLVFACLFRPMMAFAMRGSGDSLLAVGLFHAVFNITSPPTALVGTLTPGIDPIGSTLFATAVMTVGLGVAARSRLSRRHRLEVLEGREPRG